MRTRSGAKLSEIEAVYREGFAEFRRVAAAIAGDQEAALDIVQDAFGTAIRRRKTFRGEGPLEAWIWRVVVNTASDHRRHARPVTASADTPRQNGDVEDSGALAVAISLLPERQRLALFLRYYADLDYNAIADALGVRPGTVAASLNAAHAALRRALPEVSR
jgi:RNA polymerase sigma-70 factor (ECF subfamily)